MKKYVVFLQEVASSSERQPELLLYRDVRTVFERLDDTSIYIPVFYPTM